LAGLIALFLLGCHDEPDPVMGLDISRDSLLNTWTVETFLKDDSVLTDDFAGVEIEFDPSGRLFLFRGGNTFEGVWSLRAGALILSADVTDTLLRELSDVWAAQEQTATFIDMVSQNARTTRRLTLVAE